MSQHFSTLLRPGAALALAALLTAAGPAAADWLVTREGGRVETRGPWTVKGKLVVFHTADGKLSSMRLADVDLDASQRATEEAVAAQAQAAAEPEKPAERKKSVRVLTDKDFKKAEPPPAEETEGEGAEEDPAAEEPAAPAASAAGSGLVIETWSQERHPDDGHITINGTLMNSANTSAASLRLKAMVYDSSGTLMATSDAALAATALSPGQKTAFRAELPGIFSFAKINFEVQSRSLSTRPQDQPVPPPPPDGGEGGN